VRRTVAYFEDNFIEISK